MEERIKIIVNKNTGEMSVSTEGFNGPICLDEVEKIFNQKFTKNVKKTKDFDVKITKESQNVQEVRG